ncbi:APC family permease [Thiomicrorhabdus aquaedulcis]|uniref:APC family permease n=1 Tax=Thiomicrorhabdus aquaedulcis TaxID=2211106 RepID=UPI000FDAE5B9|nr:amino acid permease [Thiomicrorhabdus aquaedulcis]
MIPQQAPTLKRALSLPKMVFYGLGTTIGAGIYALIGELAGVSGYLAPMAFLVASVLAGLTALSFAELSSRYPHAAGTAAYTQVGFNLKPLSTLVGLLVILAGLVSSAALLHAFSGYFFKLVPWPTHWIILSTALILGAFALWGIVQAVWFTAALTLLGLIGLVWVIAVSVSALDQLPMLWPELLPGASFSSWGIVLAGTLLAFYAFIGFEDMVAVAEEVNDVQRTLPKAIILTLVLTTLLYLSIMLLAVLSIPPELFANSSAPLALLYEHHTQKNPQWIIWISLFAIIDGALIQIIMASRVLYGLSSQGQLPAWLGQINPKTHTPVYATILAICTVIILAFIGNLSSLAQLTSWIMLLVFTLVNLALWRIKRREVQFKQPINTSKAAHTHAFNVPIKLTLLAFLASLGFVLLETYRIFS